MSRKFHITTGEKDRIVRPVRLVDRNAELAVLPVDQPRQHRDIAARQNNALARLAAAAVMTEAP